jgi:hypothetical protein
MNSATRCRAGMFNHVHSTPSSIDKTVMKQGVPVTAHEAFFPTADARIHQPMPSNRCELSFRHSRPVRFR